MAEKLLTLTEAEWLHSLHHFLLHYPHQLSPQQAVVHAPSGTLTLRWEPMPHRNIGSLNLPTLRLTLTDDLPPHESKPLYQALDLATRRGGG